MNLIIILFLFFYKFNLLLTISSKSEKYLDRIIVIVRHGDRAPLFSYSSLDNDNKKLWPLGFGYLTNEGRKRMYRIGQFLRRRYSNQFNDNYITPRDLYIRSSSVPRCLESSQLIAAGLLPPINEWNWDSNIGNLWQPVPIYTLQKWRDGLLNPASTCVNAQKLYDRILESTIVKNFIQSNNEFIKNISSITNETLINHRHIRDYFDNILIKKHHGHNVPKWCTEIIYKKLKYIFNLSFYFDFTGIIENNLRRLRSGVLLNEIFNILETDINNNNNNNVLLNIKRFTIFVTHDSQLFHLIDALGFDMNKFSLKFGSMLIFEYQKKDDLLKLYQSNVPKSNDRIILNELKIPICSMQQQQQQQQLLLLNQSQQQPNIPLKYLKYKYKNLLLDLDQWDYECNNYNYIKQQYEF